jgi:putative ABC transport system permease protein
MQWLMYQDLRYAIRTLLRSPAFTATAALTLALGIGANTVMFSVVDAVLLRPLPFRDPDRLMLIASLNTHRNVGQIRASALDFADWRSQATSFAGMAGHVGTGFILTGDGEPEQVIGQLVTADFFDVLGVKPLAGRTLSPDAFAPGHDQEMVLSHSLWQRRFAGDRSAIGRTVTASGKPYTIVGVMPPGFEYPSRRYQLWSPLPFPATADSPPVNRASHYMQVIGRLRPGVPQERAQAEMSTIARSLAVQYPDADGSLDARVIPLSEQAVKGVRTALLVLLGAVGFVVLIACTNVTNLLLARATGRQREVAIRAALGAGRVRLIRQFLTETIVLYALGAAGALALAVWGLEVLLSLSASDIPRLADASIDARVLGVTLIVSLGTAIVFGLAPAIHAAKSDVSDALKAGGRTGGAADGRQTLRAALVVAELALSVVLLVGAGLALRSFVRLVEVDPGFRVDDQLTFAVGMPRAQYPDAQHMTAFAQRLIERLASTPGVQHAGATTHLPFSGQNMENSFGVEGLITPPGAEQPVAGMRGVTPDYFTALGVPLEAGRFFTAADRQDSPPVAIVNEGFARRYWPGQNAIGKRLKEDSAASPSPWRTVVGVVADIRHNGPAEDARPEVDLPYAQLDPSVMTTWFRGAAFVVSGSLPASALAPAVRAQVHAVDPAMPLNELQSVAALASNAVAQPRFRTVLLGAFAALALTLATIGVFGVLSYFVTQRTQEIGIRMALGARSGDVVRMVMTRGVGLAAMGIAIGLVAAIPLTRSMQALLFEVQPTDVPTFATVGIVLILVAAAASYLPARRATRVDPMTALRMD